MWAYNDTFNLTYTFGSWMLSWIAHPVIECE